MNHGSMHCFVSRTVAMHIKREPESLECGLVVSTPTGGHCLPRACIEIVLSDWVIMNLWQI